MFVAQTFIYIPVDCFTMLSYDKTWHASIYVRHRLEYWEKGGNGRAHRQTLSSARQ